MAAQVPAAVPKAPPPRPPSRTAPPPPPSTLPPVPKTNGQDKKFSIGKPPQGGGQRIVIYGPGGVGKTALASLAPRPLFVDFDDGAWNFNVDIVQGIESWQDMRDALHGTVCNDCKTLIIDSATKAQEHAVAHTLATVPHEKGHRVSSIEGYGYGKGYQYVYETFLQLLSDLDDHARRGRNVVLICHHRTDLAPNPEGEDFQRYEPDLQQPPKFGRLRDRVKNWCDHMFFVNFDVAVVDGKAVGSGSRTIFPMEMPTYWAKSRTLREPLVYEEGSPALWEALEKGGSHAVR